MPELPEVETVVRDLRPMLVGRRVVRVVTGKHSLRRPWAKAWSKAVAGGVVGAVRRRGKWIVLDLSPSLAAGEGLGVRGRASRGAAPHPLPLSPAGRGGQSALLLHLGMTGQLTVASATTTHRQPRREEKGG